MRAITCGVIGLVLLAGCTTPTPTPTPTPRPSRALATAGPGADLVCGIDRATIEMVTGSKVVRSDGALTVTAGVGTGTCTAWTEVNGKTVEFFGVDMYPVSSAKGVEWRERVDGNRGNAPALVYPQEVVDGAYWKGTDDGNAAVFWSATVVNVSVDHLVLGRAWSDDLLAMNQQVAATYGLAGPSGAAVTPGS